VVADKTESNLYFNSVFVSFPGNQNVGVHIFNEQYPGQHYPNAGAYIYGYQDNIPALKQTRNICDYKIAFDHRPQYPDTKEEIFSECRSGIKQALKEHVQNFWQPIGTRYSYNLTYFGYKHLQNNEFDHALISYSATSTTQLSQPLTSQQFLARYNSEDSTKTLKEFENFVESFQSFQPIKKTVKPFQENPQEDPDITLVRRYFWFLDSEKIEEAYQILANPDTSKEKFLDAQKDLYKASLSGVNKLSNGSVEAWVDWQIQNSEPLIKRASYQIHAGKLTEISSESIHGGIAEHNGLQAYAARRGNTDNVILAKGREETIVESGEWSADCELRCTLFRGIKFSPKGNYLSYVKVGYEWAERKIYDILKKSEAYTFAPGGLDFINPSETLYFSCVRNDFGGELQAKVYQLPGFEVKVDLIKDHPELDKYWNYQCAYLSEQRLVRFEFSEPYQPESDQPPLAQKQIFDFDSETGQSKN